jgi:hypothetical protein
LGYVRGEIAQSGFLRGKQQVGMTSVLKHEMSSDPFAMAYDYIKYRLSLDGEWYDCPDLPDTSEAIMAMRTLATDFEHQNKSELTEMLGRLDLNSNMIYPEFVKVMVGQFVKVQQNHLWWGSCLVCIHRHVRLTLRDRGDASTGHTDR